MSLKPIVLLAVLGAAIAVAGCGDDDPPVNTTVQESLAEQARRGASGVTGATSTPGTTDGISDAKNKGKSKKPVADDGIPDDYKPKKGEVFKAEAEAIKKGDSESAVRADLGAPLEIQQQESETGKFDCWFYQVIGDRLVVYCFDGSGKVASISGY